MNKEIKCLIGLDLGTSAIKGVIMSSEGVIFHRTKAEMIYDINEEKVVEFDAQKFYLTIVKVIKELLNLLPKNHLVVAISMASASGNTLLVDKEGKPITPVISWRDSRVKDEIEKVFGRLEDEKVREITGWPLMKKFPLAHLAWFKYHHPQLLKDVGKVCMSTEYINYRLSGKWGIDSSTATPFYLQEQRTKSWYLPYIEKLGINPEMLPDIYPSGTVLGSISKQASLDTGLSQEVQVVLGSFDHPSAARGAGVLQEGQLLVSCGTSWVGFYPIKSRQKALEANMLIDPFIARKGIWGCMFSLAEIAAGVDRYVCKYISDRADRYAKFDKLAASYSGKNQEFVINPLKEEQTNDLDNYSKGEIAIGLMKGVAFLLKEKIEEISEMGITANSVTMVGGPSESSSWRQIVCDILGVDLNIINGSCAGAVGAALLAGIGIGLYDNEEQAFDKANFSKIILQPKIKK